MRAFCEMARRTKILLLISCGLLAAASLAQQEMSTKGFHWEWRKSQELSREQTISRLRLTPSQKSDLISTIILQMREDQADHDAGSDKELREIAEKTNVAFVDFDGHGRNEIVAQGSGEDACSPTGNCPFWILRHGRDGYRVILDADSTQTFTIQSSRTNGFSDIVLGMHGSATDSTLTIYKFDGSKYRDAGCYEANWGIVDKGGTWHDLKEPRVTRCN
jgi:hypothetical protein